MSGGRGVESGVCCMFCRGLALGLLGGGVACALRSPKLWSRCHVINLQVLHRSDSGGCSSRATGGA